MLEAEIAEKRLPSGQVLLRDVRLALRPGARLAVLGASGAGKTTLLRILLGTDLRFTGSVRRAAARIGTLFQEPRLLPWLTVADNIRLVAGRGQGDAPDAAALLAEMGLPEAASLYPRQLSLGMARRAAFARALAVAPDLLILDEPFASLDPASAGLVAAAIQRRRVPAVIALHGVAHAVALATDIVVLAGRPATVAATFAIDPAACVAERVRVQAALEARFPFLAAGP